MKHLAIAATLLWAAFQFGGMFFFSADRATEAEFSHLVESPQRSIENPYANGYFYLFGLTAAASLDPAKTGYEIWVDDTDDARRDSGERGGHKADLVFTLPETTGPAWDADDPLTEFRKREAPFHATTRQFGTLL